MVDEKKIFQEPESGRATDVVFVPALLHLSF